MAGDSAPIYFAATYWLAKETPPTNKARNIFFGIASYFREQLDYENQSAYQCVHRQLYYFLADSCRSIAFLRYFYRWIDSGG